MFGSRARMSNGTVFEARGAHLRGWRLTQHGFGDSGAGATCDVMGGNTPGSWKTSVMPSRAVGWLAAVLKPETRPTKKNVTSPITHAALTARTADIGTS